MATRSAAFQNQSAASLRSSLEGCDASWVRKCVLNENDKQEKTYWLNISFAAARLRKRPWKDTRVIFALRPWEDATLISHDEGSLFREEGGDRGLVRPLGNGIICSVRRIANVAEMI